MTKLTALPLLATNPGDATGQHCFTNLSLAHFLIGTRIKNVAVWPQAP